MGNYINYCPQGFPLENTHFWGLKSLQKHDIPQSNLILILSPKGSYLTHVSITPQEITPGAIICRNQNSGWSFDCQSSDKDIYTGKKKILHLK